MKRFYLLLALVCFTFANVVAQKNPDTFALGKNTSKRVEMILPQVNGYNIYKADLHSHTAFSDGSLMPKARVLEAYNDGLDILAITDHLEYRTNEQTFLDYMKGYHKGGTPKAKNNLIHREAADKDGILVDLNVPNISAQHYGKRYGVLVIPGVEISRHPDQYGHFNALFIKDANKIYDPVVEKSFRKAKAQGALIMHNHPGWRRSTTDRNEWHQMVYQEGLIDGIEIINGRGSWPKLLNRCAEENLFVGAGSDSHTTTFYRDHFRTCTLIFAKECTEEAIKEAIVERRTLAYGVDNVMGDAKLLADLFNASVVAKVISVSESGEKTISVTNTSSIPYHIRKGKKNGMGLVLEPFSTGTIKVAADKSPYYYVLNMWCADKSTSAACNPRVLIEMD